MKADWEKRFDKLWLEEVGIGSDVADIIKSFIFQLLLSEKKKFAKKVLIQSYDEWVSEGEFLAKAAGYKSLIAFENWLFKGFPGFKKGEKRPKTK